MCYGNAGNFNLNQILDLTDSSASDMANTNEESESNSLTATTSSTLSTNIINNHNKYHLPVNMHILQIENVTETRNFTCQAQNSFGLVVFNLSLVIKGNFIYFNLF